MVSVCLIGHAYEKKYSGSGLYFHARWVVFKVESDTQIQIGLGLHFHTEKQTALGEHRSMPNNFLQFDP